MRQDFDRILDYDRSLFRKMGWKRQLAQFALLGLVVLGFWSMKSALEAYRFNHDWYLIEPPIDPIPQLATGRAEYRPDYKAMLKNIKPDFEAPDRCWQINSTYHSRQECQNAINKNRRAAVSTKMKTRGDLYNIVPWMLSQRCIAVADSKAPLVGGIDCLSPSEWEYILRSSSAGDTK